MLPFWWLDPALNLHCQDLQGECAQSCVWHCVPPAYCKGRAAPPDCRAPFSPALHCLRRSFAATQSNMHYTACGWRFLNAKRTAIDAALMPDALHPSAAGMERGIAQCIKPLVDALMKG